jgi:hypothetical protein
LGVLFFVGPVITFHFWLGHSALAYQLDARRRGNIRLKSALIAVGQRQRCSVYSTGLEDIVSSRGTPTQGSQRVTMTDAMIVNQMQEIRLDHPS